MCTSRDTKNHPNHPCINIRDKKFSPPPPSAAKSDFGKFTSDDPRSTNEEDPDAWRRGKCVHLEIRKITRTTHVLPLGIKKFRPHPSAAKSDFGKFTTDDPRSTNEEDHEAWRRRKGVHLEIRKITRTTHVLTLGIKTFRPPPSAAKSDFGEFTTDNPRSTNEENPEAWWRRNCVHLEIRKITRTTHVLTLGIKNFRPPISSEVGFWKIHHR